MKRQPQNAAKRLSSRDSMHMKRIWISKNALCLYDLETGDLAAVLIADGNTII